MIIVNGDTTVKYKIPKNKVKINDDEHFAFAVMIIGWSVICFFAGTVAATMIMGF